MKEVQPCVADVLHTCCLLAIYLFFDPLEIIYFLGKLLEKLSINFSAFLEKGIILFFFGKNEEVV